MSFHLFCLHVHKRISPPWECFRGSSGTVPAAKYCVTTSFTSQYKNCLLLTVSLRWKKVSRWECLNTLNGFLSCTRVSPPFYGKASWEGLIMVNHLVFLLYYSFMPGSLSSPIKVYEISLLEGILLFIGSASLFCLITWDVSLRLKFATSYFISEL